MFKLILKNRKLWNWRFRSLSWSTISLVSPAPVFLLAAIFGIGLWFLWPNPVQFPMDDAYIHLVYAQNLAETGRVFFNFPGEAGVGATSFLWIALLAIGDKLDVSMHLTAKFIGLSSLGAMAILLFQLVNRELRPPLAFLFVLLFALSGNLIWFALSGMETLLFLALGLLAIYFHAKGRWTVVGLLLGLVTLTRPEGALLGLAIGCFEVFRQRKIPAGLLRMTSLWLLLAAPWYGYLWLRTGHILPTSAIGKQITTSAGLDLIVEQNEALAPLQNARGIMYPFIWAIYLVEFVLGGVTFPGPYLPIGNLVDNPDYQISIWAIIALVLVVAPLILVAARHLKRKQFWQRLVEERPKNIFALILFWAFLHNLTFMIMLPVPGTASRYGVINHILIWLLLVYGLSKIELYSRRWLWFCAGLLLMGTASIFYWNRVYDANLDHMHRVRMQAAAFQVERFSSSDRCAVFDIGAIRYHGQRPVIDLGGLLDPALGQHYFDRTIDRYLIDRGASCLILPGRQQTAEDGWFDFAEEIGASESAAFRLQEVAVFGISRERWLQGYLPTNNYQATVVVYQLVDP